MTKLSLKGITWDHPRGYDPLIAASAAYQKDFGVEISWRKRSLIEFGDQSLTDLAGEFDLLIIDHPHMGVAAESACLAPLDHYISKKHLNILSSESAGPSFQSYHYQGHQWALPIDAAMQAGCFRPDLINHSVPTTWDEVFNLAARLRGQGKYVGKALCPTDAMCTFLSLTAEMGCPVGETGTEFVDPRVGLKALQMLRRMKEEFYPRSLDWNPIQLYDHMSQQQDVVYSPMDFIYSNYSRDGFRPNLLVSANAFGSISILGGAGIAVSSDCQRPNEAAAYCAWICQPEVQKGLYAHNQGQPANIAAWDNTMTNSLTNGFFQNTLQTLENAYVRPRYPGWPDLQEKIGLTLHRYLVNNDDPSDALKKLTTAYLESVRIHPIR